MPVIWILLLIFGSLSADENFAKLIAEFEKTIEKERQRWEVPGLAVGIVKEGQVVFSKGFGQRGLADKSPVDENTIFQIGSLSKAFTAALAAKAVDEQLITWKDKVIDHNPCFRLKDPWVNAQFEVADLLSQRSGLPSHAGDTQALLWYSAEEMQKNLQFLEPISSFRSEFAYQNIFFLVAAELLRIKTGKTYPELLKEKLLDPLEMKETTVTLEDYLRSSNRAEWLQQRADGKVVPLGENPSSFNINWTYVLAPAGGINSNLKDMLNWLIFQSDQGSFKRRELISKKNMAIMHRPYIFSGEHAGASSYYGLGWVIREYSPHPIIWHNGGTLGAYSALAFIPEERLGIVVLSNLRGSELALALAFQFFDLYFGKKEADWKEKLNVVAKEERRESALKAPPLDQYAGIYRNAVFGDCSVLKDAEGLSLTLGKKETLFRLKHLVRDTFILDWPEADARSKVFFFADGSSNINRMNVEMLSLEGDGIFEKQ